MARAEMRVLPGPVTPAPKGSKQTSDRGAWHRLAARAALGGMLEAAGTPPSGQPVAGPPTPSPHPPPSPTRAQCGHSWAASGPAGRWQLVLHLKMCL